MNLQLSSAACAVAVLAACAEYMVTSMAEVHNPFYMSIYFLTILFLTIFLDLLYTKANLVLHRCMRQAFVSCTDRTWSA